MYSCSRIANTFNLFSLEVVQNADSVNFVYYGKTRVLMKTKFKTRLTDNLYLDSHRSVNIMWLISCETTFLLFGLTVNSLQLSVPFYNLNSLCRQVIISVMSVFKSLYIFGLQLTIYCTFCTQIFPIYAGHI